MKQKVPFETFMMASAAAFGAAILQKLKNDSKTKKKKKWRYSKQITNENKSTGPWSSAASTWSAAESTDAVFVQVKKG